MTLKMHWTEELSPPLPSDQLKIGLKVFCNETGENQYGVPAVTATAEGRVKTMSYTLTGSPENVDTPARVVLTEAAGTVNDAIVFPGKLAPP